jgi:hypothetical protein
MDYVIPHLTLTGRHKRKGNDENEIKEEKNKKKEKKEKILHVSF